MSSSYTFFTDFQAQISQLVTNYVNTTTSNLIGSITPTVAVLFTIYIVLFGWAMVQGLVREPIIEFVRRALKIGIISGIALSIGGYNTYVASFVQSIPTELAASLSSGANSSTSGLDHLLNQGYDVGNTFWAQSGVTNPGPALLALLIWATVFISTGYGAYLFALSSMALGVLLAVGPLFIVLALFDGTENFLAQWIGQVTNYILVSVLTVAVVGLIYAAVVNFAQTLTDPNIVFSQAVPFLLALIIGFLLLMQVQNMASGLAGGVHIGTAAVLERVSGGMAASTGRFLRSRSMDARRDLGQLASRGAAGAVRGAGNLGGRVAAAGLQQGRNAGRALGEAASGAAWAAGTTARSTYSWARTRFNWNSRSNS